MSRCGLRVAGGSVLLAGLALTLAPGVSRADGAAPPELGSFSLRARAPGIDLIGDDSSSPSHPAGQGAFPEALASLEAGPIGYGLASIAWPGPLAGNLGSVLLVAGGVPVPLPVSPPSLPPPPKQVTVLNDPVRAEAHSPGGPHDSTLSQPGISMASHADDKVVTAVASMAATELAGLFHVSHVDGASRTQLDPGRGRAEGTSSVSGFSIGPEGLLAIRSVVSVAKASTDGRSAIGEGHTVVAGATVAGTPVTIDETGIHAAGAGQANPLGVVADQLTQALLRQADITVTASRPDTRVRGASADFVAGSIVITWVPRDGTVVSVALGGASASVTATPGFAADLGLPGIPSAPGDATGAAPPASRVAADPGVTPGGGAPQPGTAAPARGTPRAAAGGALALANRPVGHFGGLAPGLLAAAFGVAVLAGGLLDRLPGRVLDRPPATCNLEEEQ